MGAGDAKDFKMEETAGTGNPENMKFKDSCTCDLFSLWSKLNKMTGQRF